MYDMKKSDLTNDIIIVFYCFVCFFIFTFNCLLFNFFPSSLGSLQSAVISAFGHTRVSACVLWRMQFCVRSLCYWGCVCACFFCPLWLCQQHIATKTIHMTIIKKKKKKKQTIITTKWERERNAILFLFYFFLYNNNNNKSVR